MLQPRLFCISTVVFISIISLVQGDCSWYTDCGQCVADLNCAWCSDNAQSYTTGACQDATASCPNVGPIQRRFNYSCPLNDRDSVQRVKVHPGLFAYYSVTPPRRSLAIRIFVSLDNSGQQNDALDLFVSKYARPTQFNYTYRSEWKVGAWGVEVPSWDLPCPTPSTCEPLYIGVLGDNRYPMTSGPSEYQIDIFQEFEFLDFKCCSTASCGFGMLGDASCTGTGEATLQLTPALENKRGAVYFTRFLRTTTEFQVNFKFRMTPPTGTGFTSCKSGDFLNDPYCSSGDGLAFLILTQQATPAAVSISPFAGSSIGYGCCSGDSACGNSPKGGIVLDFDSYANRDLYDPSLGIVRKWENNARNESTRASHVSLFSSFDYLCNRHDSTAHVASSLTVPYFADGRPHTVLIQYAQNTLTVFVDDMDEPVLEEIITVDETLRGKGLLGFSASTGASYQKHEILEWTFCGKLGCTPIAL